MPIREEFPEAGSNYLDGESDGWEYTTIFSGSNLEATFEMIRQFLKEEGYGNVPLPADAEELLLFKYPNRQGQIAMFSEPGYVHNPIKILFHPHKRRKNALILKIYNEQHPKHLLKFHGVLNEEPGEKDKGQGKKEVKKRVRKIPENQMAIKELESTSTPPDSPKKGRKKNQKKGNG